MSSGVAIIALGNRFRGDDGVGPDIADRLRAAMPGVAIVEGIEDSMAIVNAWSGKALALVVDAAASGAPPGTLHRRDLGAAPLPKELGRCSSHGLGLAEAIELARVLDQLPERLVIYAVEAASFEPGAPLSPEVAEAAGNAATLIAVELKNA